ncbi:MAG: hypothetical protein ACO29W_13555 [Burkholderiaceae bacterium]
MQQISDRILPRDALRSSGRWSSGRWSSGRWSSNRWSRPERHGLAGNIVERHHTTNPRCTPRQALARRLQRNGIGDDHLPTIRLDSQRQFEHRLRNLELGTDSDHRVADTRCIEPGGGPDELFSPREPDSQRLDRDDPGPLGGFVPVGKRDFGVKGLPLRRTDRHHTQARRRRIEREHAKETRQREKQRHFAGWRAERNSHRFDPAGRAAPAQR